MVGYCVGLGDRCTPCSRVVLNIVCSVGGYVDSVVLHVVRCIGVSVLCRAVYFFIESHAVLCYSTKPCTVLYRTLLSFPLNCVPYNTHRHGENILLDTNTGALMHIDFNAIWGKGQLVFQVEEKVCAAVVCNVATVVALPKPSTPSPTVTQVTQA
jgi:phosphoinositide 3-/4-kinase-like protein